MITSREIILILVLINLSIICKELPRDVMKVLQEDEDELKNYRKPLLDLSCKMMVFSRLKKMENENSIYTYLDQVDLKEQFLDYVSKELYNHCEQKIRTEQIIFKRVNYFNLDQEYAYTTDVDFDSLLKSFQGRKTDL